MKELIKKQEEELTNIILYLTESDKKDICGNYKDNAVIDYGRLKSFISKIRKETAEKVCDRMTGKKEEAKVEIRGTVLRAFKQILDQRTNIGYNWRIKEEKEIKQQILKELL